MAPTADEDNLSFVLHKVNDVRLEQVPIPGPPKFNELLLRTLKVGICGSDVHYWKHGSIGPFILKDPIILGHETCAEVVSVGPGVKGFKVGDRVCTEPAVPCRVCILCKTGKYNLCEDMLCHATPPQSGTLTKYFIQPADYTFKLPDNISIEEGAMIEPLTVGVYACKRAQVGIGTTVLVTGAGPIGLVSTITAKGFGADRVVVTDINAERLKVAKEVGADDTILVKPGVTTAQLVQEVINALGGRPDVTIECSGAPPSMCLALDVTKSGGKAVMVGCGPDNVTLPIANAMIREVEIMGSFRYANCFPLAVSLVASGRVNLKPLVTHRYKFEQSLEAFTAAHEGKGIKIMINVAEPKYSA